MAKAFDLIHKVNKAPEPTESRIPFDDPPDGKEAQPKKRRVRIEILFFFVLLFIVFFIIGMSFLSPRFLMERFGKSSPSPSPVSPSDSPAQGFAIDQQGQSVDQTKKDLGLTSPSPTVSSSTAPSSPSPVALSTSEQKTGARIQILNGTTVDGAAAAARRTLASSGIVVDSIGNYSKQTVKRTTIYYDRNYKTAAQQIQAKLGGLLVQSSDLGKYTVLVVLGKTR